jgi:hypothetical protein
LGTAFFKQVHYKTADQKQKENITSVASDLPECAETGEHFVIR